MSDLLDRLATVASEVDLDGIREGEDSNRLTVEDAKKVVVAVVKGLDDATNDTGISHISAELAEELSTIIS